MMGNLICKGWSSFHPVRNSRTSVTSGKLHLDSGASSKNRMETVEPCNLLLGFQGGLINLAWICNAGLQTITSRYSPCEITSYSYPQLSVLPRVSMNFFGSHVLAAVQLNLLTPNRPGTQSWPTVAWPSSLPKGPRVSKHVQRRRRRTALAALDQESVFVSCCKLKAWSLGLQNWLDVGMWQDMIGSWIWNSKSSKHEPSRGYCTGAQEIRPEAWRCWCPKSQCITFNTICSIPIQLPKKFITSLMLVETIKTYIDHMKIVG